MISTRVLEAVQMQAWQCGQALRLMRGDKTTLNFKGNLDQIERSTSLSPQTAQSNGLATENIGHIQIRVSTCTDIGN